MIRTATRDDRPVLAALHARSFMKAWDARAVGALLETPGTTALIAADRGFAMIRVAAGEAEILTLCVAPEARRAGLGARLLGAAAEAASAQGAREMFLEVAESNKAARALYARAGFVEVGRRRSYYDAGEDALVLRCILPITASRP
jgi:ribosomal-protein-alanine N-acetyltransferase